MKELCAFVVLLVLALLTAGSYGEDRQLYVILNPNCSICDVPNHNQSFYNLIYIRADGSSDTIHYLWSTVGAVSMLMVKTELSADVTVDWEKYLSDNNSESISFTSQPSYASVVTFTKLYEYYDVDDKNDISQISDDNINEMSFINMMWELATTDNSSSDEVSANVQLSPEVADDFGKHAVKLYFIAYGNEAHADKLPHLQHTPNSFQLEMALDHFKTKYNKTRFVLEAAVLTSEDPSGTFDLETFHSIDDEYTPGVFTTVQMASPLSQTKEWGSYLQWKPVCYKDPSTRTTETSTGIHQTLNAHFDMHDRLTELHNSLTYAFFGEEMYNKLQSWVNISYGAQQDEFYQDTSYLTWTTTIGLGTPPSESFSTLVIVIIIVGFGVPAVLIIAGGIFILIRKLKSKDDDLNLSSAKLVEQQDE